MTSLVVWFLSLPDGNGRLAIAVILMGCQWLLTG